MNHIFIIIIQIFIIITLSVQINSDDDELEKDLNDGDIKKTIPDLLYKISSDDDISNKNSEEEDNDDNSNQRAQKRKTKYPTIATTQKPIVDNLLSKPILSDVNLPSLGVLDGNAWQNSKRTLEIDKKDKEKFRNKKKQFDNKTFEKQETESTDKLAINNINNKNNESNSYPKPIAQFSPQLQPQTEVKTPPNLLLMPTFSPPNSNKPPEKFLTSSLAINDQQSGRTQYNNSSVKLTEPVLLAKSSSVLDIPTIISTPTIIQINSNSPVTQNQSITTNTPVTPNSRITAIRSELYSSTPNSLSKQLFSASSSTTTTTPSTIVANNMQNNEQLSSGKGDNRNSDWNTELGKHNVLYAGPELGISAPIIPSSLDNKLDLNKKSTENTLNTNPPLLAIPNNELKSEKPINDNSLQQMASTANPLNSPESQNVSTYQPSNETAATLRPLYFQHLAEKYNKTDTEQKTTPIVLSSIADSSLNPQIIYYPTFRPETVQNNFQTNVTNNILPKSQPINQNLGINQVSSPPQLSPLKSDNLINTNQINANQPKMTAANDNQNNLNANKLSVNSRPTTYQPFNQYVQAMQTPAPVFNRPIVDSSPNKQPINNNFQSSQPINANLVITGAANKLSPNFNSQNVVTVKPISTVIPTTDDDDMDSSDTSSSVPLWPSENEEEDEGKKAAKSDIYREISNSTVITKKPGSILVLAPGTFYFGTKQYITVFKDGIEGAKDIDIQIEVTKLDANRTSLFLDEAKIRGNSSITVLVIKLPVDYEKNTKLTEGNLVIRGEIQSQKRTFKFSRLIFLQRTTAFIPILQTDRAIYKPGEKVKVRLIVIDSSFRAPSNSSGSVWIENSQGIKMAHWEQQDFSVGLIQFVHQIHLDAALGRWSVKVNLLNLTRRIYFEVKPYTKQRFFVDIFPPRFILADETTATFRVCAKYKHGREVPGKYYAVAKTIQGKDISPNLIPVSQKFSGKLKKCVEITVDLLSLGSQSSILFNSSRVLQVTVTEYGTGISVTASHTIKLDTKPRKLLFTDTGNPNIKPGIPYRSMILVVKPDKDPAVNEKVEICLTTKEDAIGSQRMNVLFEKMCAMYISDSNGQIKFTIPPLSTDTRKVRIEARALQFPDRKINGTNHLMISQPVVSRTMGSWWSASAHYLQIEPLTDAVECVEQPEFKIYYSLGKNDYDLDDTLDLKYLVTCQNQIVAFGTHLTKFKVEENIAEKVDQSFVYLSHTNYRKGIFIDILQYIGTDTIRVKTTGHRGLRYPTCSLMVFYLRIDGELVGDTQVFSVKPCFHNEIQLSFKENVVKPRDEVSMTLIAPPNSLCGITAFDESIYFTQTNKKFDIQSRIEGIGQILKDLNKLRVPCDKGETCVELLFHELARPNVHNRRKRWISWPPNLQEPDPNAYDMRDAIAEFGSVYMADNIEIATRPCVLTEIDKNGNPIGCNGLEMEMRSKQQLFSNSYQNFFEWTDESVLTNRNVTVESYAPIYAGSPRRPDYLSNLVNSSLGDPFLDILAKNEHHLSWLFDLHLINDSGLIQVKYKVPDAIANWIVDAVCVDPQTGFGLSSPVRVIASQPIFLTATYPKAINREEVALLKYTIHNYHKNCAPVSLTIATELSSSIEILDILPKFICVCRSEPTTVTIKVRSHRLGVINVLANASIVNTYNDICLERIIEPIIGSDIANETILIKTGGFKEEFVRSALICANRTQSKNGHNWVINLNKNQIIKRSIIASFSVWGDVFAKWISRPFRPLLPNLPQTSCESTLLSTIKYLMILEYRDQTVCNNVTVLKPEIESKILQTLKNSYQRLISFRTIRGAFTTFPRDSSHFKDSFQLTSLTVLALSLTSKHIFVDKIILKSAINYLINQQNPETGCWSSAAMTQSDMNMDPNSQQPSTGSTALTTIIINTLLQTQINTGLLVSNEVVSRAMHCFDANNNPTAFELSLISYAYALSKQYETCKKYLARLLSQSITAKNHLIYWSEKSADINWTFASVNILTASYFVLTALEENTEISRDTVSGVVKWIVSQQNSYGGFHSTFDTMIALRALQKFSMATKSANELTTRLKVSANAFPYTFFLNESLRYDEQRKLFPIMPALVTVRSIGTGCYETQVSINYHISKPPDTELSAFDVTLKADRKPNLTSDGDCPQVILTICLRYALSAISKLTIVAIDLVSGYEPYIPDIIDMVHNNSNLIANYEYLDDTLKLYVESLSSSASFCFNVSITQLITIEKPLDGTITVFDFSEPLIRTRLSYTIPEECGEQSNHIKLSKLDDSSVIRTGIKPILSDEIEQNNINARKQQLLQLDNTFALLMMHEIDANRVSRYYHSIDETS